jgi:hypothetical protein
MQTALTSLPTAARREWRTLTPPRIAAIIPRMRERFSAWRRRRKERRDARRAGPKPTLREMVQQSPAFFLLSGLLIAAEAGLVGIVAGTVINKDWQLDPFGPYAFAVLLGLAFLAWAKGRTERFIDSALEPESDDDRFKRLIREVLDERGPGSEVQPEASD